MGERVHVFAPISTTNRVPIHIGVKLRGTPAQPIPRRGGLRSLKGGHCVSLVKPRHTLGRLLHPRLLGSGA